jgi:long-chain acyl-CoA synthetase
VNLAHIIDPHDADRVAIINRSRATTYGELRDQVARVRGGLAALGVGQGDRVALVCANSRKFVVTYLATVGLGAVAVPLNPTSPAAEIAREINAVEASVVLVQAASAAAWNAIDRAQVPSVLHVIGTDLDVPGATTSFAAIEQAAPVDVVEVDPETLAVLIFTSGTAGSPRAAMLSHRNLLSNLEQGRAAHVGIEPGDVVYGVLPMFHIFGLNVVLGLALHAGATVVLVQRFDPFTALETIRERNVTVIPGAPPMWLAFSHFDDRQL